MGVNRAKRAVIVCLATFLSCLSGFSQIFSDETFKIGRTLGLIENYYVDSADLEKITEKVITDVLKELDPHSTYISAKDVAEMNEPLEGNFDGIGIQFNILRDTIIVVEPISGGPSEKVGLMAGDRIVVIDAENVAGKGISTNDVRKRLMGPKGTKVSVSVVRNGSPNLLEFTIVRDKIPIESLDASYMIDNETAYFKFNKFAATTEQEFKDAIDKLPKNKINNVIIDLRNNGGGVMNASTDMADHFFDDNRMLVYMEGLHTERQSFISKGNGDLAKCRLVVLTNESSASASEIFAGSIQDWDRGVIVGRRTFGKGLVQGQFYLTDGSMVRLTVARYYTPTGRLIQSPYDEGYEKYVENYNKRFQDGELLSPDSILLPNDSLKFKTLVNGRAVYGGGGITPDVFVPADTLGYSDYYGSLSRNGVFNTFVLAYADKNRTVIRSKYPEFKDFQEKFEFSKNDIKDFIAEGEKSGIKYSEEQYKISEKEILLVLKALVASNLWGTNEYYMIINESDPTVSAAMKVFADKREFNNILGNK